MTTTLRKLTDELMKLDPGERIELAEALMASVPDFADAEIEKAWREEIDHRLDEYEAGRATLIPAEESFARARKALRETRRSSVRGRH